MTKCDRRSRNAGTQLNGHGRLVVRPSGTEPVIRIMGEGDDKIMVEEVVDGIVDALTAHAVYAASVPSP